MHETFFVWQRGDNVHLSNFSVIIVTLVNKKPCDYLRKKKSFQICVISLFAQGPIRLPKRGWASSNARGTICVPFLVEIGLTDLPKPGWAIAHSANSSPRPLNSALLADITIVIVNIWPLAHRTIYNVNPNFSVKDDFGCLWFTSWFHKTSLNFADIKNVQKNFFLLLLD